HARCGVISAAGGGRSAMGSLAFAGGEEKPAEAFGLLPGFIFERKDQIVGAVADNPAHVGLRLSDTAGIVARGRTLRVIGDSPVTIVVAAGAGEPTGTPHE